VTRNFRSCRKPEYDERFNAEPAGNIHKPADFRDLYQILGVYKPVDLNNNTGMHYTYASPGTAESYRKTGKFATELISKKTVWVVMFQRSQPTGYTYKAIRSLNRSKQNGPTELTRKLSEGELECKSIC